MTSLYRFDSDMDGILDVDDACPLEPETYNLYLDTDGCPDSVDRHYLDTHSQILMVMELIDRWDACIDEPENFNGFLDEDGCPEIEGTTGGDMIDSDYDGLADHLDQCPTIAERYNKFQDEDGCPDSIIHQTIGDSDGDGIFDDIDQCPTAKETIINSKMKTVVQTLVADNKF